MKQVLTQVMPVAETQIDNGVARAARIDNLREWVVQRGCYSKAQNLEIYETWFRPAPRYLFRAVDRKYGIRAQPFADVGCYYGANLVNAPAGSYGIETDSKAAHFAQCLGLPVHNLTVTKDDLSHLPKVKSLWCSAVIEHVDSPHNFLRELNSLLVDGGIMVMYAPTIPLIPALRKLPGVGKYFSAYVAADHVSAFTPRTLAFTCERAGFEVLEMSPFLPGALALLNRVPPFPSLISGSMCICRKVPGWTYPQKSSRLPVAG